MGLAIESYHENYLPGMMELYNVETAFEPHIAELTVERFVRLVTRKSTFDPEGLLVAVEDGTVVGWVHACLAGGTEPWNPADPVCQIRMLIFPPSRTKLGCTLVKEATEWMARSGQRSFLALHCEHGYPFYRGVWLGGEPMGPATMPHLHVALEISGYEVRAESIFLTALMQTPPAETRASVDVKFEESPAEMSSQRLRESWDGFEPMQTVARLGDEEAGAIRWVVLDDLQAKLGAPAVNIWALSVGEKFRRKGIASALVCQAMASAFKKGARHASVGTQLGNVAAHATYARFGFVPHCMMLGRTYGQQQTG